jgi:hypothetical protein
LWFCGDKSAPGGRLDCFHFGPLYLDVIRVAARAVYLALVSAEDSDDRGGGLTARRPVTVQYLGNVTRLVSRFTSDLGYPQPAAVSQELEKVKEFPVRAWRQVRIWAS